MSRVSIAYMCPAAPEAVSYLLALPISTPSRDTRSEWLWIRLADGTLILGFFPQGDEGYFGTEVAQSNDWQKAEANGTVGTIQADVEELVDTVSMNEKEGSGR